MPTTADLQALDTFVNTGGADMPALSAPISTGADALQALENTVNS